MKDFKKLQEMDRRMRELAGLYAAERERADSLAEELRVLRENRTCKDSLEVGDAAKMREALKYLRDASREFCHLIRNSKYIGLMDKYKYAEVARIRDAIANAGLTLAAPARNCDVGTAEEQAKRYMNFCHNYPKCTGCPCVGRMKYNQCDFVWMQMPYEEVKKDEQ